MQNFNTHLEKIISTLQNAVITSEHVFSPQSSDEGVYLIAEFIRDQVVVHESKVLLIGNGGSAAIASHSAIDFVNSCLISALNFSDISAMTCMSNDYGYENSYAHQIEVVAKAGDILIAISSSGQSPNILNAVTTAKRKECFVITFSGFQEDNPLRSLGDYNIYVPSCEYGVVEIAHQVILHAITDYLSLEKSEFKPHRKHGILYTLSR